MSEETTREFLEWTVGEYCFGIEVSECKEVHRNTPVYAEPHMPPFVMGIANLRGTVSPVISVPALLGLPVPPRTDRHVLVRVQAGAGFDALYSDDVRDVFRTGEENLIQEIPSHFSPEQARFMEGAVRFADRTVLLLKISEIIHADRVKEARTQEAAV